MLFINHIEDMKGYNLIKFKLNGFTIAELLVTMVLTSLAILFAYSTLGYVQKLFYNYKQQNRFVTEYCVFKQRFNDELLNCDYAIENGHNIFKLKSDSNVTELIFLDENIVFKKNDVCDTFHVTAKKLQVNYETITNPEYFNRLVAKITFQTDYSKQKFNFYFCKTYDASVKLKLNDEIVK